ncbi:MAG: response regulator [Bacteroidales bacterium]
MTNEKKIILYVDDEAINVELFKINFKKHFDVLTAYSGHEGLDVLQNQSQVAAIVSDMKMPRMHGVEFIREVKSRLPQVPCFILTGYDITPEISDALLNDLIVKYFQKPMDVPLVLESIIQVLDPM